MAVEYHTHDFVIPTATDEQMAALDSDSVVVTPEGLGTRFGNVDNTSDTQKLTSGPIADALFQRIVAVANRTDLKALDTTKSTVALLQGAGRDGVFRWVSGDFTARIAADPSEGVFIKANAISAGSGAWVRVGANGLVDSRWFGVVGDYTTDDTAAFTACVNFCGAMNWTLIGDNMNIGVTSIDLPEGFRARCAGGAKINTWIMTKDKANIRPGYKNLVSGFNIWLKGAATKTYTTDRSADYQSFTYGLSYLFTSAADIEGVGIIQDMDVYTAGGALTTSANDNRASYDVGMVVRSYGSRFRKCTIFGYWGTGKNGLVLHSQTSLANTDSDYFTASDSDFTGVAILASNSGTQGLTGSSWVSCGFYNGADHHAASTAGSGDYTKPAIYIDGSNGANGIRGHKFLGGNLRTRANEAVKLGYVDAVDFEFSATETPPLAGVTGADQQGTVSFTANTGRVRTNIASLSSTTGLGFDAIAAGLTAGSFISIGGQNQDEIVVAKAGAITRTQAGSIVTGLFSSLADAIVRAATGSVVRGQVNTTTVFTADATRFSVSTGVLRLGGASTEPVITTNAGTPEGAVTAVVGSICTDKTNGKLYIKATGTGNTGWVVVGTQT